LLGLSSCESCNYSGGVSVPENPVPVPLNLAWEHVLEIHSGGTRGPIPPTAVHGVTDPAACRALVVPQVKDGDDMRLIVIGNRIGRCTVDLDYANPKHDRRMTAKIQIEFTAAETLPTLAVGAPHLAGPTMFDDARCEIAGPHFRCFPKDTYGSDERHTSCATSSRCGSSRGGPQGFELCVASSGGVVTGITTWLDLPRDEVRITGAWGDGGCTLANAVP
jgi:hypothetical protein